MGLGLPHILPFFEWPGRTGFSLAGPCTALQRVNGGGRFGGKIAGGHPQAFPRPRQPLCSAGLERA